MSLLRKLTVGASLNSSTFGILTNKHESTTYVNVDFNNRLAGVPVDCNINIGEPVLRSVIRDELLDLTGLFVMKEEVNGNRVGSAVCLAVQNNKLMVVADSKGLIWYNPELYCSDLVQACLKHIMSGPDYELRLYRERSAVF